jgi:hypothetical protein
MGTLVEDIREDIMPLDTNDERRLKEVETKVHELWQQSERAKYNIASDNYLIMGGSYVHASAALSWATRAGQEFGGNWELPSSDAAGWIQYSQTMAAGKYTLRFLTYGIANGPMFDILIDSNLVAYKLDQYDASTKINLSFYIPVIIPGTGVHEILVKVDGKNGSSTGYYLRITAMQFTPANPY